MPRFRNLIGDFEVVTGEGGDAVTWRFARTLEIERAFTLAEASAVAEPSPSGPRRRRSGPLSPPLSLMLEALTGWEGVLDSEGQAVPYSEQAFFEHVPSARRVGLLREWTRRMRGGEPGSVAPGPGDEPAAPRPGAEQPTVQRLQEVQGGVPASVRGAQGPAAAEAPVPPMASVAEAPGPGSAVSLEDQAGQVVPAEPPVGSAGRPAEPQPLVVHPVGAVGELVVAATSAMPHQDLLAPQTSAGGLPGVPPGGGVPPASGPTMAASWPVALAAPDDEAPAAPQTRLDHVSFALGEGRLEAASPLDDPHLASDPRFADAVQQVYERLRRAEEHEPWF
ncbi:MAG: hypothetical protein FJX74_08270 [Armatimonadetes bacterium]|nr:hypothetical protein [Armatimonadota bacterium]